MAATDRCELPALIAVARWNEQRAKALKKSDPESAKRHARNAQTMREIAKEVEADAPQSGE